MGYFFLWVCFSFLVAIIGDKRKIGFGWSLFWALILSPLIGLIIVLTYDKKENKLRQNIIEQQKFEHYFELGKKAEFKKNYETAIDNYMDALYHLENDYDDLSAADVVEIQEIKDEIQTRIEALEFKRVK